MEYRNTIALVRLFVCLQLINPQFFLEIRIFWRQREILVYHI